MDSEQHLIEKLRQRDATALSQVFETYSDLIYRLALRLLNDESIADGVVQDTFLALIEHIDSFEGRASLSTWLYRVAYNNAMGRLRRLKPELELDDQTEELPLPAALVDWQTIPEALFNSSEALLEIDRAIQNLNPPLRAVFILRDIEELSTEETARTLGITPNTVKVRLHRARLALREQLAGYFQERLAVR